MTTALATTGDVGAVVARTVAGADVAHVTRLIRMVSARVARKLLAVAWEPVVGATATITPHDGDLRTPQWPVTSVTSVTVGSTDIDPSQYTCTTDGRLKRTSPLALAPDSTFGLLPRQAWPLDGEFGWPPIPTTIVYNPGFSEIPGDISLVVAECVAGKWLGGASRAEGVQAEAIDNYSVQFYAANPAGTAWSPEHQETIDSYRRGKVRSLRLG